MLTIALAVVNDDGALPATLLVVVQFAEVGDHMLPWPGLGTRALNQGVGVSLAVFVACVSAQDHAGLLVTTMIRGRYAIKV